MGQARLKSRRTPLPRFVVEYEVPKGSGKWFVYFRQPGQKNVRMHGMPGTPEWEELYRRLLAGERPEKKTPNQPIKGTFGWLCQQYMASTKFEGLHQDTRIVRRGILTHCMEECPEGSKLTYGEVPLSRFTPKSVANLRDAKRGLPHAGNARVKTIRAVFSWATLPEVDIAQVNPARDVQCFETNNPNGHHTWTIEEVEQFERYHPLGTKAHLALAILLYTGQRRSDVVLLGRQHEREGWLCFTQQKNIDNKPIYLELPIVPQLRRVLDASPTGDLVYLMTEYGKPYTDNGFGNWFRERCIEAGVPGRAHGLRKACATRLANARATNHEIMAVTGHQSSRQVDVYTKAANQRRLAESAMKR